VVNAQNAVQPYDWATFLHARVDAIGAPAPLDGLARSGWKLVYTDKPAAGADSGRGGTDFNYSLGLSLGKDNKIGGVAWNSVAFKAGLAPGMVLVAVNGEAASGDVLKEAVTDAKADKKPIVLLVNSFDHITELRLDYHEGLRYPHLERIEGTPDRLSLILAPKK
jgi:predicted metalloprotease with PDZ domain